MSPDLSSALNTSQPATDASLARTSGLAWRQMLVLVTTVALASAGLSAVFVPSTVSAQTKMGKRGKRGKPSKRSVKKRSGKKRVKGRAVKKRKKKRSGLDAIYFRYGLGFGGCLKESDTNAMCPNSNTDWGPGFIDAELGYRQKMLGVELQISQNQYQITDRDQTLDSSFLFGGLGIKVFPNQHAPIDPYFGVRVGGMSVSRDDITKPLDEGFMFSVLGGVDYRFARNFGVGTSLASHWLQGQDDTASFWTWRTSFVVYFDASGSSRHKKKHKSKRRKKRRKKRTPKY